jgi:aryl-alcohol dehydrogenase-like predicted oxidoreductase
MRTRTLGQGLTVPEVGLGCMGMSQSYGAPDDQESVATIHRALDIVAIPGTKRRTYLGQDAAAADVVLTPADLAAPEQAVPRDAAAGERYPDEFMAYIGL